jgi:ABC-type Zn uptake system ZnuABC Zn-binding protein ZnuA
MDAETYADFTTALGEEYCEVVSPFCEHGADPHDGYEVFGKAFGFDNITPEKLHAAQVSNADLTRIRDIARQWHESDQVTVELIGEVIRRVLWRWPPASR